MYKRAYTILCIFFCIVMILSILCNIQLLLITQQMNETTSNVEEPLNQENDVSHLTSERITQKNNDLEFEKRITIDKFVNPSLWEGIETSESGSIQLKSSGNLAETFRKYDGFLSLGNYLMINVNASACENIEWIAFFLLEDMSYSNYYECNLKPLISNGENNVIVNRKDFIVGTGKPDWNRISSVKIAFQTKSSTQATISLHEISTYNAKPMCSFWFDDGWKSTYTEAFPVLEEKGFQGVLSVISSHVGYENFCSKAELDVMYEAGWDLVNHTHNHKNLIELTSNEAEKEIALCRNFLVDNGYTRACDHFVPPYCTTNKEVDNIIAQYAVTSRPNWDAYNYLPIIEPYGLCFKEVTPDFTPEMVFEWIDKAIDNDLWLILLFHSIETPADTSTKYDIEDFKAIVDYLDERQPNINIPTISQVIELDIIEHTEELPSETKEAANSEWTLVWGDEFNQTAMDSDIWNAVDSPPFKNNELQIYRPHNVVVKDGCLNIISSKENSTYFSGAVTTNNNQLFQYGKIEIRAKLPKGKGIFPAIWMLPQSGAVLPEVDIIEFLGNTPNEIWHVMHYEQNGTRKRYYKKIAEKDFTKEFHIFTLEWTKDRFSWLIDGKETYSIKKNIPSEKMYLYINTAIGGNWPGSPNSTTEFPQTMLIDYVKYYTQK